MIAAYERALALDPQQSEALAVKGLMTQLIERDWEAAGRLYQRALASNETSYAVIRAYALFYLQFINRQFQAIELFSDMVKLDPLHAGRKASLAGMFYFVGDKEGAIREARKALQLDPEHIIAIDYLTLAYTDTKDIVALESLQASIRPVLQEQPEIRALFGWSYAVRGDEEKARKIYRELLKSIDGLTPIAMINTASLALVLDETEEGIDLLERLEKSGSWLQFYIKLLSPLYDPLREHPRYQALLQRMGLDDESIAALNRRMSFD